MSTANVTTTNGSAKRKDPPPSLEDTNTATEAPPTQVTPTALRISPYEARKKFMVECSVALGDEYAPCNFEAEDILIRIPGKLDELGIDDIDDISDVPMEEVKDAWNSLTEDQVDEYSRFVVIPSGILDLFDKYKQAILFADERNSPGETMLMLNTHSSWCMYPVINKQLNDANKEVIKALKATTRPGVAKGAFKKVFAALLACHECDHWRLDTESPEDCDKIAKKISNILKNLLKFNDEELGLVDPHSRKALLGKFQDISEDWAECDIDKITFKTAQNGQGMGRPRSASGNNTQNTSTTTTTPAAKKPRTLAPLVASTSTNAGTSVLSYLSGIQDKLHLRVKTNVQITISSTTEPDKNCRVIVSGATSMKKMGQLCAYMTGFVDEFHYHSQRGKSLKGSFFEIRLRGDLLWVAEKALAKIAATQGAGHVIDKGVKIVQVFQGLICSADGGMTFDSESARTVATTAGSVVWNSGNGQQYELKVEGILANKSRVRSGEPLPRLVTDDYENARKKTGFGKNIHRENSYIMADRQVYANQLLMGVSKSELRKLKSNWQAEPICTVDGKVEDDRFSFDFTDANVNSAGQPLPMA